VRIERAFRVRIERTPREKEAVSIEFSCSMGRRFREIIHGENAWVGSFFSVVVCPVELSNRACTFSSYFWDADSRNRFRHTGRMIDHLKLMNNSRHALSYYARDFKTPISDNTPYPRQVIPS